MAGVTGQVCIVAQGSDFLLSLGQQVILVSGNNQQRMMLLYWAGGRLLYWYGMRASSASQCSLASMLLIYSTDYYLTWSTF